MEQNSAWLFDSYGGKLIRRVDPNSVGNFGPLRPSTLRVRIRAVGLNPVDYKILAGEQRNLMSKKWPKYLGSEFSGEIIEGSSKDGQLQVGTLVYGMINPLSTGCIRETMVLHEYFLVPHTQAHETMAALPVAFSSIWQSIGRKAQDVLAGKRSATSLAGTSIFVLGANGGIGSLMLQVAALLNWTIGASASAKHRARLEAAVNAAAAAAGAGGGDAAQSPKPIQKFTDNTTGHILEWTERGVLPSGAWDIYYDTPGLSSAAEIVSARGTLAPSRFRPALHIPVQIPNAKILSTYLRTLAPLPRVRTRMLLALPLRRALQVGAELVEKNTLAPVVDRVFPVDRVNEAYDELRKGGLTGKLVLKL